VLLCFETRALPGDSGRKSKPNCVHFHLCKNQGRRESEFDPTADILLSWRHWKTECTVVIAVKHKTFRRSSSSRKSHTNTQNSSRTVTNVRRILLQLTVIYMTNFTRFQGSWISTRVDIIFCLFKVFKRASREGRE